MSALALDKAAARNYMLSNFGALFLLVNALGCGLLLAPPLQYILHRWHTDIIIAIRKSLSPAQLSHATSIGLYSSYTIYMKHEYWTSRLYYDHLVCQLWSPSYLRISSQLFKTIAIEANKIENSTFKVTFIELIPQKMQLTMMLSP